MIPPGALDRARLLQLAADCGFDLSGGVEGSWLVVHSSHCPLRVWLGMFGESVRLAAFSMQNVARALGDYGTPLASPLPEGAKGGRTVTCEAALHRLLLRAYTLANTLPDELLHRFEAQIATMPSSTEAERLVVQRVGQDLFRQGLLELWEGRCAITGLAVTELLRASHIKPWAECASDAERLDVYNGLLLAPHLDAAFDRGFLTVDDDGSVILSDHLDAHARAVLGLDRPLRVHKLKAEHRAFLRWHRARIWRRAA